MTTTGLTTSFGWTGRDAFTQHDVQELARVLFDALEREHLLVDYLFKGTLVDYLKCKSCGNERVRNDTILDLSLVIKRFGATAAVCSIEEALEAEFLSPEVMDGDNCVACERCAAKTAHEKGMRIGEPPYLLQMQLKRFVFDFDTMARHKLNDRVTFPMLLDLNRFVVGANASPLMAAAPVLESTADRGVAATNTSLPLTAGSLSQPMVSSDPFDGDVGSTLADRTQKAAAVDAITATATLHQCALQLVATAGPHVYELYAVLVHSGSAMGGHYYAYVKDLDVGSWWCFNDSSVNPVTEEDVLSAAGGNSGGSGFYSFSAANAYMLMWRRVTAESYVDLTPRGLVPAERAPARVREVTASAIPSCGDRSGEGDPTSLQYTSQPVTLHSLGDADVADAGTFPVLRMPRALPSDAEVPTAVRVAVDAADATVRAAEAALEAERRRLTLRIHFRGEVRNISVNPEDTVGDVTAAAWRRFGLDRVRTSPQAARSEALPLLDDASSGQSAELYLSNLFNDVDGAGDVDEDSSPSNATQVEPHEVFPLNCVRLRTYDAHQDTPKTPLSYAPPSVDTVISPDGTDWPSCFTEQVDDAQPTSANVATPAVASHLATDTSTKHGVRAGEAALDGDAGLARHISDVGVRSWADLLLETRLSPHTKWPPYHRHAVQINVVRYISATDAFLPPQRTSVPRNATLAEVGDAVAAVTGVPRNRQRLMRISQIVGSISAAEYATHVAMGLSPLSPQDALKASELLFAASTTKNLFVTAAPIASETSLLPVDARGRIVGDGLRLSRDLQCGRNIITLYLEELDFAVDDFDPFCQAASSTVATGSGQSKSTIALSTHPVGATATIVGYTSGGLQRPATHAVSVADDDLVVINHQRIDAVSARNDLESSRCAGASLRCTAELGMLHVTAATSAAVAAFDRDAHTSTFRFNALGSLEFSHLINFDTRRSSRSLYNSVAGILGVDASDILLRRDSAAGALIKVSDVPHTLRNVYSSHRSGPTAGSIVVMPGPAVSDRQHVVQIWFYVPEPDVISGTAWLPLAPPPPPLGNSVTVTNAHDAVSLHDYLSDWAPPEISDAEATQTATVALNTILPRTIDSSVAACLSAAPPDALQSARAIDTVDSDDDSCSSYDTLPPVHSGSVILLPPPQPVDALAMSATSSAAAVRVTNSRPLPGHFCVICHVAADAESTISGIRELAAAALMRRGFLGVPHASEGGIASPSPAHRITDPAVLQLLRLRIKLNERLGTVLLDGGVLGDAVHYVSDYSELAVEILPTPDMLIASPGPMRHIRGGANDTLQPPVDTPGHTPLMKPQQLSSVAADGQYPPASVDASNALSLDALVARPRSISSLSLTQPSIGSERDATDDASSSIAARGGNALGLQFGTAPAEFVTSESVAVAISAAPRTTIPARIPIIVYIAWFDSARGALGRRREAVISSHESMRGIARRIASIAPLAMQQRRSTDAMRRTAASVNVALRLPRIGPADRMLAADAVTDSIRESEMVADRESTTRLSSDAPVAEVPTAALFHALGAFVLAPGASLPQPRRLGAPTFPWRRMCDDVRPFGGAHAFSTKSYGGYYSSATFSAIDTGVIADGATVLITNLDIAAYTMPAAAEVAAAATSRASAGVAVSDGGGGSTSKAGATAAGSSWKEASARATSTAASVARTHHSVTTPSSSRKETGLRIFTRAEREITATKSTTTGSGPTNGSATTMITPSSNDSTHTLESPSVVTSVRHVQTYVAPSTSTDSESADAFPTDELPPQLLPRRLALFPCKSEESDPTGNVAAATAEGIMPLSAQGSTSRRVSFENPGFAHRMRGSSSSVTSVSSRDREV